MASQEQVPHASRVGHVAYRCCAGPRWSSFSLHLLIIISHSTICAEGYFGAAAHMRHACQPLPADPCSRFCENLTSLRTGTNRVASLDVQLARQSLTQFQPGQIENLAADSRTFSRILLPATRSSLTSPQTAGLLEHFGFDASLPRVDALHSLHRSNLALVWLPGKPAMKASQSRPLQYSDESYSSFGIGRPANLPESTDCAEKLK